MAKYGSFAYGEEVYGKTAYVGEGTISPSTALESLTVWLVSVGEGIVQSVGSFIRTVTAFRDTGEGEVAPISLLSRTVTAFRWVGQAGNDAFRSIYGTFKYGQKTYTYNYQQPRSDLERQATLYRSPGQGIVSSAGKVIRQTQKLAGGHAVLIIGVLSRVVMPWVVPVLRACLDRTDDLKAGLKRWDDIKGRLKR